MRAEPRARRGRALALAAAAVLLALTAFAWWLSGRWLERPEPPAAEPTRTPSHSP